MAPSPSRLAPVARVLALVLAFALATMGVATRARAESATSALSWVRLPGSESCIAAPELGARIEKHLGRPVLVSPSVADVSIEGRTEAIGTGAARRYRVVVGGTRRDGTLIGAREMTSAGSDCRALDDGLVLVVALMIDPNALAPAPPVVPPPGPPLAQPLVSREVVSERTVVHEIERVGPPPWLVEASVTGVVAIARVSGAAPGLGVALRAGPGELTAFQLMLGMVPSAELTVGSRRVELSILEAGLAFCPAVSLGTRAHVGGCAGLRLGAVRSQGRGFASDRQVDRGLADVAIGPNVQLTLVGPLFGVASASAIVPLVRQQTTVTDAAGKQVLLDERSAIGAEVGIGLGVHFSP